MDAHRSPPLRPSLHRLAGIAFDQCSIDMHKASTSADPIYINSPVCAGLQHRCRFSPSALAYNAAADSSKLPLKPRSSLLSVSRGLVYINIPGRTCLHELFIEHEQVTAWVARFSFNKMEANYHILSTAVCTGGLMGRRTSRRHYSLVNFKSPVGRNHWPSC